MTSPPCIPWLRFSHHDHHHQADLGLSQHLQHHTSSSRAVPQAWSLSPTSRRVPGGSCLLGRLEYRRFDVAKECLCRSRTSQSEHFPGSRAGTKLPTLTPARRRRVHCATRLQQPQHRHTLGVPVLELPMRPASSFSGLLYLRLGLWSWSSASTQRCLQAWKWMIQGRDHHLDSISR